MWLLEARSVPARSVGPAAPEEIEFVDALDVDVLAGLGGIDHIAVAYVDAHVVDIFWRPEEH